MSAPHCQPHHATYLWQPPATPSTFLPTFNVPAAVPRCALWSAEWREIDTSLTFPFLFYLYFLSSLYSFFFWSHDLAFISFDQPLFPLFLSRSEGLHKLLSCNDTSLTSQPNIVTCLAAKDTFKPCLQLTRTAVTTTMWSVTFLQANGHWLSYIYKILSLPYAISVPLVTVFYVLTWYKTWIQMYAELAS